MWRDFNSWLIQSSMSRHFCTRLCFYSFYKTRKNSNRQSFWQSPLFRAQLGSPRLRFYKYRLLVLETKKRAGARFWICPQGTFIIAPWKINSLQFGGFLQTMGKEQLNTGVRNCGWGFWVLTDCIQKNTGHFTSVRCKPWDQYYQVRERQVKRKMPRGWWILTHCSDSKQN